MLTKEQIDKAANSYSQGGNNLDELFAFRNGAKWAIDKFLKGLWHPASEFPNENRGGKVLILYKDDTTATYPSNLFKNINGAHINAHTVQQWLYMDDLIQKKGGKQ